MMIHLKPAQDEAVLLKHTADRFVADKYGLDQRAQMLAGPADACPRHWQDMADLGWLAAPLPEAVGGLGLTPPQLGPLLGALGAGLVLEPYGPAMLHCATTLAQMLPATQASRALAPMLAGDSIEVLVSSDAEISATPQGADWKLSGSATLVPGGAAAQVFWVLARGDTGLALFRVPARDTTTTPYRLVDGQIAAKLCVEGTICSPTARFACTKAALEHGKAWAEFGALAEANGIIDALFQATLDYVKQREQFGRPIGRFQVLQHRMAEMFIRKEEVQSMTQLAADVVQNGDPVFRRRILAAAKVKTIDAARAVIRDAVQLHGGMGMTDEMRLGHLVKRLLVLIQLGGARAAHLARFQAA